VGPGETTAGRSVKAGLGSDAELLATVLAVHGQLELESQLQLLVERAVAWLGADCGFVLAPGEERSTWSPVVATVAKDDPRRAGLRRVDPERVRAAIDRGERVFEGLGPFQTDGSAWPGRVPEVGIALPVTDNEQDWAAVLALLGDARPAAATLERVERLLQEARVAVSNALRVRSLRELVIKDDTAHCFNRRYFESCLPEELSRANRFHSSLSLIFLDMDNLKEVNQAHGHSMGSQTLREVSRRIRLKVRRFDKLFRFGGDEFCVVLPETEWHGALEVAERIRDAIASKPFLVGVVEDPAGVSMTASLGIASFPLHARTQEELIEHADRAMQRVKRGTKNSIGIAEILGGKHGS
jgi:diguanylate cyclase (GGDEF)-like protein